MFSVTFLQECELAKFPATPTAIAYASKTRKHLFPRGLILQAKSVRDKEGFTEIVLERPIHTYYRWYIPTEYDEYIRIEEFNTSPVGCIGATIT